MAGDLIAWAWTMRGSDFPAAARGGAGGGAGVGSGSKKSFMFLFAIYLRIAAWLELGYVLAGVETSNHASQL